MRKIACNRAPINAMQQGTIAAVGKVGQRPRGLRMIPGELHQVPYMKETADATHDAGGEPRARDRGACHRG
jgi:hypothetical protein